MYRVTRQPEPEPEAKWKKFALPAAGAVIVLIAGVVLVRGCADEPMGTILPGDATKASESNYEAEIAKQKALNPNPEKAAPKRTGRP